MGKPLQEGLRGLIIGILFFAGCQTAEQQVNPPAVPGDAPAALETGKTGQPGPMPVRSLFADRIVFSDTFDDNRHKWTEKEDKQVEIALRSGEYRIEHKPKTGAWMETVASVFEYWEDFTIETTIARSSGVDNHGYGIVWGGRDNKNYYCFMVSGDGHYKFAKISSGKWTDFIKWKKSEHIRTGFSENKLTVKKIGTQYEFYINDNRVATHGVETFFGNHLGFIVNRNMQIRVHDITVTGKWNISQIYGIIKIEAEKGSPYHQALLGEAYRRGYPFKEDDAEGARLIQLSAEKSHPFGLFKLAGLYENGEDFEHDAKKAEALYKEAFPGILSLAEAGDAFARDYLGDIYYNGYGTEKDFKQAKQWYEKAVAQGNYLSRYMLGVFYANGQGVAKDYDKALPYFLNEARKGYYLALYAVGVFYDNGWGVKEDKKAAKGWYERAIVINDYHNALNNLARFYQWGLADTQVDLVKAREMFKKAAEKGNQKAPANYANMLKAGEGGPKDEKEAVTWYRKGAEKGDERGMRELSVLYFEGKGVEKDPAKAIKYAYFGARDGDVAGTARLDIYDIKSGLLFPVRITWKKDTRPKDNLELDQLVRRAVEGYQAGMTDIGRSLFKQAVALDAGMLYKDNVWAAVYKNRLPMSLVSELLTALKETMQDRPDYWFFYAHGAVLAGQPALALPAAERMESAMARNPEDDVAKMLNPLPGLLKAAAMVQMGKAEDAYKMLFAARQAGKPDPALIWFINKWLKPLLKDKKKLAFVLDIHENQFAEEFTEYPQQSYHHPVSGTLIQAVGAAPKLETEPKPEMPERAQEAPAPQAPVETPKSAPKAKIID